MDQSQLLDSVEIVLRATDYSSKLDYIMKAFHEDRLDLSKIVDNNHVVTPREAKKKGYGYVFAAATRNQLEIAELFISYGCQVNKQDGANIVTSLHLVVLHDNIPFIKLLLDNGSCINAQNEAGCTPLHLAVMQGSVAVVQYLLNRGASVKIPLINGESPLFSAIEQKNLRLVLLLIDNGAPVRQKCNLKLTPLHFAAQVGCLEIVKLLLVKGAKINALNDENQTPLHVALHFKRGNVAASGANIHRRDVSGVSILYLAVLNNYSRFTKWILKKKANINAVTNDNITPVYYATLCENEKIIRQLLSSGADINIADKDGLCPLHVAVQNGCYKIVELLLASKADVNKTTKDGITPIYLSAVTGCEKLFLLLLRYESKVDIHMVQDNKNILFHAVRKECRLIVEYILKHCDLEKKNLSDLIKIAALSNNKYIFNLLVQYRKNMICCCQCHRNGVNSYDERIFKSLSRSF